MVVSHSRYARFPADSDPKTAFEIETEIPFEVIQMTHSNVTKHGVVLKWGINNGHFRNLNWRYLPYIRPM